MFRYSFEPRGTDRFDSTRTCIRTGRFVYLFWEPGKELRENNGTMKHRPFYRFLLFQISFKDLGPNLMNMRGRWTGNCRFKFKSPIQIMPESLVLNRWLKFEQAVGRSATKLKFIKFGNFPVFLIFPSQILYIYNLGADLNSKFNPCPGAIL